MPIEILDTKQPEHGDYACNFALAASKKVSMNPRQVAELLKAELAKNTDLIQEIEIAGPGFINLRLKPEAVAGFVSKVLNLGPDLAKSKLADPQKINVEFVSVNPNGPITIGSGRGAAYGSALCRVLETAGNAVHREYYINDGVNSEQMRQFAESVIALTEGRPVPEKGYKGDYVADIADQVANATWIDGVLSVVAADGSASNIQITERPEDPTEWIRIVSEQLMIARQRNDLAAFGVTFDTWFSEQSLHVSGEVQRLIDALEAKGAADEGEYRVKIKLAKGGKVEDVEREIQAGAEPQEEDEDPSGPNTSTPQHPNTESARTLWLRSTKFGDDMDRVLRRKDGRLTYIASDVAYHKDKFNRPPNADKLITVLGPDHHGYIARLEAVVSALLMQPAAPDSNREPLNEFDEKIYSSPEDRDACQAALAEAKQKLEVQIFQLVRFVKDGQPAPMRKRDGNIYALIDLIKEIGQTVKPNGTEEEKIQAGRDVARFFYLMRSHDTTLDFDLDLAAKQSDENPVFYVQYAHARICSVLAKAGISPDSLSTSTLENFNASRLSEPKELNLIKKILDLPWEVRRSADDYGVHRLTTYAVELARTFHNFYDACRVIQPDEPELTQARLALCQAARLALQGTLDILGISAPVRMDREEPVTGTSGE